MGDWLAIGSTPDSADVIIHALLPRRTVFARQAAGGVGVQIVAANVDVALLVAALNGDLNSRQLERYVVAARESGATPVIVLTKADLSENPEDDTRRVTEVAVGVPVVTLSALTGQGVSGLVHDTLLFWPRAFTCSRSNKLMLLAGVPRQSETA